jgi:hypothetical protein
VTALAALGLFAAVLLRHREARNPTTVVAAKKPIAMTGPMRVEPDSSPRLAFLELQPPAGKPQLLRDPVLLIQGRISDPGVGPVTLVIAERAPVVAKVDAEGRFRQTIDLHPETRRVEVRAGHAPREVVAEIPVEIDTEAPSVVLEVPAEWKGGPLRVSCEVKDDRPKLARFSLLADGALASESLERSLIYSSRATVDLIVPPGATSLVVRVEAEDSVGRTSHAERSVKIDRTPPRLSLKKRTFAVRHPYVSIQGDVAETVHALATQDPVRVVVVGPQGKSSRDDIRVRPHKGRFEARLQLGEGEGTYEAIAVARDVLGNVAQERASILYDPTPPRLVVEGPPQELPHATEVAPIAISATEPLASLVVTTRSSTGGHEVRKLVAGERLDAGPWRILVPVPPGGWARTAIVAKDAAMNEAHETVFVRRGREPAPPKRR